MAGLARSTQSILMACSISILLNPKRPPMQATVLSGICYVQISLASHNDRPPASTAVAASIAMPSQLGAK